MDDQLFIKFISLQFANFVCKSCTRGDDDNYLLLCDICDNCYHTYCLIPALMEIPRGQWRCPKCVAHVNFSHIKSFIVRNKKIICIQLYHTASPSDAYGFEQSGKEYSLQEFGEMADEFKRNYFKRSLSVRILKFKTKSNRHLVVLIFK